ncbi:Gfo/Idh/MocA family protein [Microlunatus sp. Gsoil 973]|uniref:Gfo/Idh/MocA family protein n=1 Tax=Microlunatus sp. Gsoil 973 TaxID=2672569 RepID=UPI0018A85CC3|nr:Gfo/Idh/MocA family oxidoreductase [Microlunatus sp. Gsoil 973]
MSTERVAVIGLGQFGLEHLRSYLELGHEICCAVDISEPRTQMIADAYAVPTGRDGVAAINSTRPTLVSIVTGPLQHRSLVEAALAVGARVLVEKPFSATVADAQVIAGLPEARDAVTPGHILRFDSAHRFVADQVSSGTIGSIIAIDSERHREHGHARRYADHSLSSLTLYHDLDLGLWLDNARPVSVTAQATPSGPERSATYLSVTVGTDADTLWTLRCSWQLPDNADNRDRLQVFGTKGVIELTVTGEAATVTITTAPGNPVTSMHGFATTAALRNEIAAFAGGSASSVVSVDDAIACVRLVQAVDDAVRLGETVRVEDGFHGSEPEATNPDGPDAAGRLS